jgi:hypothetical protein
VAAPNRDQPRRTSVVAVRDVVERTVGPFADNEYYDMEADGLEPRFGHLT